jgi:hypothetical protein
MNGALILFLNAKTPTLCAQRSLISSLINECRDRYGIPCLRAQKMRDRVNVWRDHDVTGHTTHRARERSASCPEPCGFTALLQLLRMYACAFTAVYPSCRSEAYFAGVSLECRLSSNLPPILHRRPEARLSLITISTAHSCLYTMKTSARPPL